MSTIGHDELYPRDGQNRYRIYRLRKGALDVLGTTPTPGGVGVAIVGFSEDGEFEANDAVGVLDVLFRGPNQPGKWLANPFATGR